MFGEISNKIARLDSTDHEIIDENFAVIVPSSKRNIRLRLRYDRHSYFVKFPDITFCFDLQRNLFRGEYFQTFLKMKVFYHYMGNLYICALPNHDANSNVCFDEVTHKFKVITTTTHNTKKIVQSCIEEFFSSDFNLPIYIEFPCYREFAQYFGLLNRSRQYPYILANIASNNRSQMFDRRWDIDFNFEFFEKKPTKFFEYWEAKSNSPDFKIFDCDKIKTAPCDLNNWIFRSKYFESVQSIPYFKDFMKL